MSKPVGRNNSKIITRNQGGGNKLQGLAPMSTHYFMAKSTGQSYYTETGDGRNRDFVLCVNQLGGIGRGRSQFRPNADGNRGTFCIKPLLSVYAYKPDTSQNILAIYVNPVNNIETLFPGIGQGMSGEQFNLNYGNIDLSMTSYASIRYQPINSNIGAFTIMHIFDDKPGPFTFNENTYSLLESIPATQTIIIQQIIFNLISGLSFTISKDGISRTFNNLNNDAYYQLIRNNNWYKIFLAITTN